MMRRSLRGQIVAGTVSLILGFIGFALLCLAVLVTGFAMDEIEKDLNRAREALQHYIGTRRARLVERAIFFSRLPCLEERLDFLSTLDRATARAVLDEVRDAIGSSHVILGDRRGRFLDDSLRGEPLAEDLSEMPGVRAVLGGRAMDTIWRTRRGLLLVAITPVKAGGRTLGFLAACEKIDDAVANELRIATGRDVLIIDGLDKVAESRRDESPEMVSDEEIVHLRTRLFPDGNSHGVSVRATLASQERIAVGLPLHEDGGTAVLSRSMSEIGQFALRSWIWLFLAGAAMAGVGIVLSLRTAKRIALPLRQLMLASQDLADGDLSAHVRVESEDEVGELGRAFNEMARRIESLVQDVRRSATKAEQANRAKDKFLASVSHEMRTPLTSVRAYAEILLTYGVDKRPQEEVEFLEIIKSEAERLTSVIDEVLDLVRIEAGRLNWDVEMFDLRDLLTESLRLMTGAFQLEQLKTEVKLPQQEVLFSGDRGRLRQTLLHVLRNACKFSPPGGRIYASLRVEPSCIELRIADEGPGVTGEKEKVEIFEKFYQQGEELTDKPAGAGLGLAISKEIITAHGGVIVCEDRDGGGAEFVIRLPTDIDDMPALLRGSGVYAASSL